MAIERIPCGGWDIDTSTLQFQNKVLKAVGGITGAYLPLSGGIMDANAIIEGTDEIQIAVGDDSSESGVIGVTQNGVTLEHNTNSDLDASIRVIENVVEINANSTSMTINGTGVALNGANITGVGSIVGQNSGEVAIETTLDMNNHNITNLAEPASPQDAVTKQYADNIIPVLDMGTVSDTPPVELAITAEQIALAQQENAIVKVTYQGITLQLEKIGQSATQIVFSGYISENNIYFYIDVTNTKSTFNIAPTRQIPETEGVQNGYGLLVQDGQAVWGAISSGGGLPTTGGTMTGAIDMGNNGINNLASPSAATDAANKQYVDNAVPVAATTTTLGTVKQIANIEQFQSPSSATAQEIADKFNNLIQNLINSGIMVAGT